MGGHDLLLGGPRPAGRPAPCSGAAAPWRESRSSPASSGFPFPRTKTQAEHTGRKRRRSRAQLGAERGPRACRGDVVLAVAEEGAGEIQTCGSCG